MAETGKIGRSAEFRTGELISGIWLEQGSAIETSASKGPALSKDLTWSSFRWTSGVLGPV